MLHTRRLHNTPRTAPQEADTPDILVPALERLRACKGSIDALILADQLPELLLPSLAWHASARRALFEPSAIRAIVKYCGKTFLQRTLGIRKTWQLWGRHVDSEYGMGSL
jgi:hypothetical protein